MNPGSAGRIPGALCSVVGSGHGIYAAAVPKQAIKELGKGGARLLLKKGASRFFSKVAMQSKAWGKAFEHIAEHLSLKAAAAKATHTVFAEAFRNRAAVEKLIMQAAKKYSKKYVRQMPVHGESIGRWCVVIEKEFPEVIGETFELIGGQVVKRANGDCRWLRLVIDYTGRPITAYPFIP